MKSIAATTMAILLGACAGDIISIKSAPKGATVTVAGYGECETPCRIQLRGPVMATVAKAGYDAKRYRLIPGQTSLLVELELAAPSGTVETGGLPPL